MTQHGLRHRGCCESYRTETHSPDCVFKNRNPPTPDAKALLVPHARKCGRCGATVVLADPLDHYCDPSGRAITLDYGRVDL